MGLNVRDGLRWVIQGSTGLGCLLFFLPYFGFIDFEPNWITLVLLPNNNRRVTASNVRSEPWFSSFSFTFFLFLGARDSSAS